MSEIAHPDKRWLRRRFDRAAPTYEAAAALAHEVAGRMAERLELLRAVPSRVLDAGSGTGHGARLLRRRYPGSVVVEADFSLGMLARSARRAGWWRRGLSRMTGAWEPRVCADVERLPFADASFDMVWSNLALQWLGAQQDALAELYRVLRPGGVCLFSTLGPDTLKELRAAYAQADSYVHVHRFIDLHDYGDMLVHARFADPVMDMEYFALTYPDVQALLRELKAASAGNADPGRRPGLTAKVAVARMEAAYSAYRRDGRVPATFEVIYGHAWRPETSRTAADGRAVVAFHHRPARGLR
ncbi:MAG: malonyl-ACP O-methyltransferase BioC [Betaproteobacteria bacterium]|nr:malonyl-ACP O-methyltransferase BioC [Betaproteobacteria bacterium]